MEFDDPIRFIEALEKLREREVLPSGFDSTVWRNVPVWIRERAFFSSRVESARVLQRMQDYLSDYLAEERAIESHGGLRAQGRAEFVADMRELAIREGLGRIDPETGEIDPVIRESDLTDIRSLARLELIFDTQTEAAQEYGYWQQGQDPDVLEVFPAQRFIRVRPVESPRRYHEEALGEVRRKDDLDFWLSLNRDFGVPWGPWGFNSGCGVEDVDRDEAVELGVMQEEDEVRPVEREFNEGLQAGVREMGAPMREALERVTGGSAAGGVLRPAPPAVPKALGEAMERAGIAADRDMTEAEARRFLDALKKDHGILGTTKVSEIKGAVKKGVLTRSLVEQTVDDFAEMLPKELLDRLPDFEVEVKRGLGGAAGDFSQAHKRIRLSRAVLKTPAAARKTLMHEMLHWVHELGGPEVENRVRDLWDKRTGGEPLRKLRPWNSSAIRGLRDKWLDADGDEYAGRVYPWEIASASSPTTKPRGVEVLTRHLEKLADPARFSKHWNHRSDDGANHWRDASLELLKILF